MTEDLRRVTYPGFTNMLQALGMRMADYSLLHERPVRDVTIEDEGGKLVFHLVDGRTLTYEAQGDCCSDSWIAHITVPPDIEGAVFHSYSEETLGEKNEDYNVITFYQTSFACDKGEVIVEYRNSSNGYYGGYLVGPTEDWARAEIHSV